jgi:imidazoleglycerol-phosphate dehydratase
MKLSSKRETRETKVEVSLSSVGRGTALADTGVELLDTVLSLLCSSSGFDLELKARGDLETGDHHTTEDVAIALGSALAKLPQAGTGSAIVPSGSCLAMAAVAFGEPCFRGDFQFQSRELGGMALENFSHFMRTLAYNGSFTLHLSAHGGEDRRKVEAMAIALGSALRSALAEGKIAPRSGMGP